MRIQANDLFRDERAKRWAGYFVKAIILFVAFFAIAQLTPFIPPICVAVAWALLSIGASIRPMYHFVMKKVYKQHGLKEGGFLTRINAGRTLSIVIAFAVSAICVAGLLLEAPKWGMAEWILAVIAIPLFPLAFAVSGKIVNTSIKPPYQLSLTIKTSCIAVGAILCLAFLAISIPDASTSYDTYAQAAASIKQPFKASPTALLTIAGDYNHIAESLTAYGVAKASLTSSALSVVLRAFVCVAAFFAIARLFSGCILRLNEVKLAFQPLDAAIGDEQSHTLVKPYIALSCLLPILLVVGFLVAESYAERLVETDEYKITKTFVLDQAEAAASLVDDKYLVSNVDLENLALEAGKEVAALAEKRDEELVPLVNAMYDKRIENVDAYLDWYYSPFGEADRIAHFVTGNEAQEQFYEQINQGVNDAEFMERCEYYVGEFDLIVKEFRVKAYELRLPEDLARKYANADVQPVKSEDLVKSLEPNQNFLQERERLSIGVGFGPETGRFIGFFDGFVFLPIDQLINRENYKEAIVAAIEKDRAAMIEKVKASNGSVQDYLSEFLG